MKILIVTPASQNSTKGNRVTALRWSRILEDLGYSVKIIINYTNQSADILIALHALKSISSILNFRKKFPNRPLIITLTGTDLYRDIKENPGKFAGLALLDAMALALLVMPVPGARVAAGITKGASMLGRLARGVASPIKSTKAAAQATE